MTQINESAPSLPKIVLTPCAKVSRFRAETSMTLKNLLGISLDTVNPDKGPSLI